MTRDRGRYVPLSLPRRWIGDMLHFARQVPVVAGERTLRVAGVAEARKAAEDPPGWSALIIKGFALVSQRLPELRRAYMPFPWGRLYESPYSVASVVIDRVWRDEHATFLAPMVAPESQPLGAIHDRLHRWKTTPPEAHGVFRRLIRTSRFPRPLRRALWA